MHRRVFLGYSALTALQLATLGLRPAHATTGGTGLRPAGDLLDLPRGFRDAVTRLALERKDAVKAKDEWEAQVQAMRTQVCPFVARADFAGIHVQFPELPLIPSPHPTGDPTGKPPLSHVASPL